MALSKILNWLRFPGYPIWFSEKEVPHFNVGGWLNLFHVSPLDWRIGGWTTSLTFSKQSLKVKNQLKSNVQVKIELFLLLSENEIVCVKIELMSKNPRMFFILTFELTMHSCKKWYLHFHFVEMWPVRRWNSRHNISFWYVCAILFPPFGSMVHCSRFELEFMNFFVEKWMNVGNLMLFEGGKVNIELICVK